MSRFSDYDDYEGEPEQILAMGRWKHNARAALKGKRGRKALADLREALLALPEHRLISGALCTVGGVDERLPLPGAGETAAHAARLVESGADCKMAEICAHGLAETRAEERHELRQAIEHQGGEGVCAIGAFAWYQKVKAGMDPAEAFSSLPLVHDGDPDGGDQLGETAEIGKQAGLVYTLAWELAYRNDETYRAMTPEERWTAFVAWIDKELATAA